MAGSAQPAGQARRRSSNSKRRLRSTASSARQFSGWPALWRIQALALVLTRAAQRADRACNEEALALTAQFLAVSPENYTIWNYRREILKELLKDKTEEESKAICKQELSVVDSALAVNPKVYCLWWHRRWLIGTGFCDPQRELQLCAKYLDLDERNFHTWYYRMDMAKLVRETPEDALAFTTKKINQNCSNYSAWHFRSKFYPQSMQKSSPKGDACLTPDVLKSELALVQQAYFTEPSDQSAWLYHRWLLNESKVLHPEERKDLLQQECARVEELLSLEPEAKFAHLARINILRELGLDEQSILDSQEKLVLIDPKRQAYYRECFPKA